VPAVQTGTESGEALLNKNDGSFFVFGVMSGNSTKKSAK
jgi:hypothetical protein